MNTSAAPPSNSSTSSSTFCRVGLGRGYVRVDCSDGDDVGPPNDTDLISVSISATGLAGVVTVALIALLLILGAIWWARKGKLQNLRAKDINMSF